MDSGNLLRQVSYQGSERISHHVMWSALFLTRLDCGQATRYHSYRWKFPAAEVALR